MGGGKGTQSGTKMEAAPDSEIVHSLIGEGKKENNRKI